MVYSLEELIILTTSEQKPNKNKGIEVKNFITIFFQKFLKASNKNHYSRFTDKGPTIAFSRKSFTIKTIRNLFLKKPVFEKGNADWITQRSSVIKKYNNTIHQKETPIEASK